MGSVIPQTESLMSLFSCFYRDGIHSAKLSLALHHFTDGW
uniref:Uncharacterized protein n=1 Tax=Anguilla anguilla TaxID=7936 RepID=A0A0E9RIB4_ANGAN